MKQILIFMIVCLLLVGTIRADIISDAMKGIGGIIEGAKDIINLDKSSTTISLSNEAKQTYKNKEIKVVGINQDDKKEVYQIKIDNRTFGEIDIVKEKCVRYNVTIKSMKICTQWNKNNKCIKNKNQVQRNRGSCIEYATKSKSEIQSEIDSKSKTLLESRISKSINSGDSLNVEREIRI